MTADRAERLDDIVAVETMAPGMARVVTFGGAYPVDARGDGCNCPDKQYNLAGGRCKHEHAAYVAHSDVPAPFMVSDDLNQRVAADGGECETCATLPEGVPCAECYISGDKEFNA